MASPDMNAMIRGAGNRSRKLPDIGQGQDNAMTPNGNAWGVRAREAGMSVGDFKAANPRVQPGSLANTPAVQAANAVMGSGVTAPMATVPAPPPQVVPAQVSPMAAPPAQNTMTMSPPGNPAEAQHYNYEPQADGSWRVYPPGIIAPGHLLQASLPRAASTADYRRMRQAFQTFQQPRPPMV